jgi:hypothetical protein
MIPVMIPESSIGRWPRGLKYTVRSAADPARPRTHNEKIVPLSGTRVRWYDPTKERELPDRLIEVATGLTDPSEFVDEFGLLGFAQLHAWEGVPRPEMGDVPLGLLAAEDPSFAKQLKDPRAPAFIELATGEPLYWFKAHARTVQAARNLIICLRLKDDNRLRELLETLSRKQYAALGDLCETGAFDWVTDYAARDLMAAGQEALIGLINPNIQGVQRKLHIDNVGQLKYSFTFTALIQIIYWHLASLLNDEELPPRFCQLCGEPFFPADPRQRYCPKSLGKSRSVCGARAVKETFKQRWPNGRSGNSSNEKRRLRPRKKKPDSAIKKYKDGSAGKVNR